MSGSISQETCDSVGEIVKTALDKRFHGDKLEFNPIVVTPEIGADGDDILVVKVVFDGDHKRLDPCWTGSMILEIYPQLDEANVTAYPVISFVEKSEWDEAKDENWTDFLD